jgi:hypothetical protein
MLFSKNLAGTVSVSANAVLFISTKKYSENSPYFFGGLWFLDEASSLESSVSVLRMYIVFSLVGRIKF